jgi:hypothetical protein
VAVVSQQTTLQHNLHYECDYCTESTIRCRGTDRETTEEQISTEGNPFNVCMRAVRVRSSNSNASFIALQIARHVFVGNTRRSSMRVDLHVSVRTTIADVSHGMQLDRTLLESQNSCVNAPLGV